MKKHFVISVAVVMIFIPCCFAQTLSISVNSTIEKVTVYVSSAQVYRKATVNLSKGKNEIEFKNLSPYIDKQSIVVGCKEKATVLAVTSQLKSNEPANKNSDIKKLEEEKADWLDKMKLNQNMMKVFQTEENILLKNQQVGNEHTILKAVDLKDMADFQRNRLTEIYLKQIDISKTIDGVDSALQRIDRQIFALKNKTEKSSGEIKVILNAEESTSAEISFTYIVPNAGWYANYDLRVKDVNSPIDLKFKANVFQQTGEDWKDVKLQLSNSNPSENSIAPYLPTWLVNQSSAYTVSKPINNYVLNNHVTEVKGRVYDNRAYQPIAYANVLIEGSTMGTITDENGNFSIKVTPLAEKLIIKSIGYDDFQWLINLNEAQFPMQATGNKLQQVVVSYKKPLRDENYVKDVQVVSRRALISEEIKSAPVRELNSLVSVGTAGVYQSNDLAIRGERGNGTRVYVDGIQVRSDATLPNNINQQLVYNDIEMDVLFDIAMPYSIPTDGKSYQVDIKTISMPAYYEYYAIPKLDKSVYLTAHVPNWQDFKLLDGELNLFLEGKFIGKSVIQTHFAADTLSISMGKDNGIFIERKRVKDFSKNQILGDNKIDFCSMDIVVKNNKPYPIHLKMEDQFPLSTEKKIVVDEIAYTAGKLDKDTRKILWDFDLGNKEEKHFELKYSVKHPRNAYLRLE